MKRRTPVPVVLEPPQFAITGAQLGPGLLDLRPDFAMRDPGALDAPQYIPRGGIEARYRRGGRPRSIYATTTERRP